LKKFGIWPAAVNLRELLPTMASFFEHRFLMASLQTQGGIRSMANESKALASAALAVVSARSREGRLAKRNGIPRFTTYICE